jgi:catechol 2,3-dioxygenase-like lactoylglutathione lyase family enzyme
MKSYTIEHVGIAADDTRALADWYRRSLGFREFFRTDDPMPTIFMRDAISGDASGGDATGVSIEIFARKPSEPKPAFADRMGMHLAIVVDDFEAAVADLEARGVVFLGGPKEIFAGGKARFFADPEGNRLHIVHRPKKPW